MAYVEKDLSVVVQATLTPTERTKITREAIAAYIAACIQIGETDRIKLYVVALNYSKTVAKMEDHCPLCKTALEVVTPMAKSDRYTAVKQCSNCGYTTTGDMSHENVRKVEAEEGIHAMQAPGDKR
jgi:hypothetical protein